MTEMILDVEALPEVIYSQFQTKQVLVKTENGTMIISPAEEKKEKHGLESLRGFLKGGGLTVDYFLAEKRNEKELEYALYEKK